MGAPTKGEPASSEVTNTENVSNVPRRHLQAGERLFHEGDPGDHAYLVVSGRLEITKATRDDETVLAVIGRGEIVGEMALINDCNRTASVRAVEPTTLIIVTRDSFKKKLANMDPLTRHLIRKFTTIIRNQDDEIARLRKVVR
ncbi:MAG: cAMP-binding protein [Rhodospirillaceae bacterium]|nr:MAG: cAMP-binding protein [Rhodospirillaceae bacterium]